ncbi:MAG: hypothetical protein RBT34_14655 [Anaerolineaceae bacterium]|jgi:hypothetical protein|nr:hypothetical protein [Anaerolineaceae bacterium]
MNVHEIIATMSYDDKKDFLAKFLIKELTARGWTPVEEEELFLYPALYKYLDTKSDMPFLYRLDIENEKCCCAGYHIDHGPIPQEFPPEEYFDEAEEDAFHEVVLGEFANNEYSYLVIVEFPDFSEGNTTNEYPYEETFTNGWYALVSAVDNLCADCRVIKNIGYEYHYITPNNETVAVALYSELIEKTVDDFLIKRSLIKAALDMGAVIKKFIAELAKSSVAI